jgi:DNA-binding FadR family transcriptional regulator
MEVVLSQLRGSIEEGRVQVGEKLPAEAALSAEFGVSRAVVREALRGLQALGLTESRTGRGTFVISARPAEHLSFGDYSTRDLLEVRRHVEVPVAGYAAARHTPDDLDRLWQLIERMDVEEDAATWVALDSLFHIAIARASGNPAFARFIEDIREALAQQSSLLNQLGGRLDESNTEHRRIVAAIAEGVPEAATEAMATHLARIETAVNTIISTHPASVGGKDNR